MLKLEIEMQIQMFLSLRQKATEARNYFPTQWQKVFIFVRFLYFHLQSQRGRILQIDRYTQSPIMKNDPIRNGAEILGKFKERTLSRSKLRNA